MKIREICTSYWEHCILCSVGVLYPQSVCWPLSIHDITITPVTLQVESQVMDTLDSRGPRLEQIYM